MIRKCFMTKVISIAVAVVSLGAYAMLLGAASRPGERDGQIDLLWQKDYAAAQQAARQSGKPLFVVFR